MSLWSFEGCVREAPAIHFTISGGHSGGGTPLPIPNRAVKPASADGTRRATSRESRSPPNYFFVLQCQTSAWHFSLPGFHKPGPSNRSRRPVMTRSPNRPLQHGEVFLRRWHVGDIRALVAACGDGEITRWTPVPADYDEAAAAAYVHRADELWDSGRGAGFAIVGAATGELLGAVELRLRSG